MSTDPFEGFKTKQRERAPRALGIRFDPSSACSTSAVIRAIKR